MIARIMSLDHPSTSRTTITTLSPLDKTQHLYVDTCVMFLPDNERPFEYFLVESK